MTINSKFGVFLRRMSPSLFRIRSGIQTELYRCSRILCIKPYSTKVSGVSVSAGRRLLSSKDNYGAGGGLRYESYHHQFRSAHSHSFFQDPDAQSQSHNSKEESAFPLYSIFGGGLLVLVGFLGVRYWNHKNSTNILHAQSIPETPSSQVIATLPTFKSTEVAEHYDISRRVWVTFHRGVYDVTEFVSKHPGGDKIMMAAGGSLEPFWELYPTHQRPDVYEILEKHRIGNLSEEDQIKLDASDLGHFQNEPKRHPAFLIRAQKPFNGESPPVLLPQKFLTPNELFYVRNHLPVPAIDVDSYRLEIVGLGLPGKEFDLSQLHKFPPITISATIQCGGNRRSEMGIVKPVAGLAWTGGAIGNAEWTGVSLMDVLVAAGFKPQNYPNPHRLHIHFEGMDSDQSGECYGSSIPLSYLLDNNFQLILAFEMNHRQLPIDHGYPVRIILPGIVGARSTKWLSRIVISEEENQSPWQQRDYKVFNSSVTMETVDFSAAPPIMDTPVTSYVCSHKSGDSVPPQGVVLEGYAFSGGGRSIVRVELSTDEGKTWQVAKLTSDEAVKNGTKNWAWSLWSASVDLSGVKGDEVEVWVKAVDSGYNQQAENFTSIYNYRGLLANAIHKIHLKIKKT